MSPELSCCIAKIFKKRDKAVSLLPVGITAIIGDFAQGDLIAIKAENGEALGLGIAGYNSQTLSQILGQKEQKVFVHYNKIYIFDKQVTT